MTRYAKDEKCYYSQANNSIESILSKFVRSKQLETCGSTAIVNAIATMFGEQDFLLAGGGMLQPEDVVTCWLNDPANQRELQLARLDIAPSDYMGNRVPQYFPNVVKAVFGRQASFSWGADFDDIRKLTDNGQAIICCLKDPSHYITFKDFNIETNELIYDDPWPSNYWPDRHKGKSGFSRTMNLEEFESNVQGYKVVFHV